MSTSEALYYPYIHIRPESLNWLKATLLCFPRVHRMVPPGFEVNDHPSIATFTRLPEGKEPLLKSFELEDSAYAVQTQFGNRLLADARERESSFFDPFRKASAEKEFGGNDSSFQIHKTKMVSWLLEMLQDEGLAWTPSRPNRGNEWVAVHPRLGEAFMSTIAAAIASDHDMRVVTNGTRPHRALVTRDPAAAYDMIIRKEWHAGVPDQETVVDELAQAVITTNFNVGLLTSEEIAELAQEGGPLARFKEALEEFAITVGKAASEQHRDERVKEAAEKVIERWQAEQKGGIGSLLRKLTSPTGLADEAKDFVKDVAKDVVQNPAGPVAAVAGVSFTLGSTLLSAGAGLAVAAIFYAGKSLKNHYSRRAASPFRYLTRIEEKGAAFVIKPPLSQ